MFLASRCTCATRKMLSNLCYDKYLQIEEPARQKTGVAII